jgi:WD40 repeat protein
METKSIQGQSPAAPIYILRGHGSPIHALNICNQNLRLISGDANGWIIIWDLVTKRPVTAWKAHAGAVLEVKGFNIGSGITEIYTYDLSRSVRLLDIDICDRHGRDHKLCVWKIRAEDESFLEKTLPVDAAEAEQTESKTQPWLLHCLPVNALNFCSFSMAFVYFDRLPGPPPKTKPENTLFAVPNAMDSGGVDIFHLPSERRISTIPSDASAKTGMLMAVNLFVAPSGDLCVASAYEDGHVMIYHHRGTLKAASFERENVLNNPLKWERLYACRPHTQPVLSIDVSPTLEYFISSSADDLIIKHPIPSAGSPGYIPTAGYKEESPLKTVNTKHSGQQGLRIRSDGKVFATAGWDSRIRVYSCKTMKELAVLKWHKDGCYAVTFGNISDLSHLGPSSTISSDHDAHDEKQDPAAEQRDYSLATVHQQRNLKVQQTHWLAAGSKDGKISLWDIY